MKYSPLTAALVGLKIGVVLCLFVGCEPAPTPADDACVEDAPAAPEKSVVVAETQADEWSRFTSTYPYLAAEWQRTRSDVGDKANVSIVSALASTVSGHGRRIQALEDKPDCCLMPAASPIKSEVVRSSPKPPAAPPTNIIDDAEQRSTDDGEKLIILLTKDGCSRCAAFKANIIGDDFYKAIHKFHFLEVNTSRHPEAIGRFDIPGDTLLPVALLWNPETQKFHQIPADPAQSLGDFLSELGLQQATPPRKRLRNLLP